MDAAVETETKGTLAGCVPASRHACRYMTISMWQARFSHTQLLFTRNR